MCALKLLASVDVRGPRWCLCTRFSVSREIYGVEIPQSKSWTHSKAFVHFTAMCMHLHVQLGNNECQSMCVRSDTFLLVKCCRRLLITEHLVYFESWRIQDLVRTKPNAGKNTQLGPSDTIFVCEGIDRNLRVVSLGSRPAPPPPPESDRVKSRVRSVMAGFEVPLVSSRRSVQIDLIHHFNGSLELCRQISVCGVEPLD